MDDPVVCAAPTPRRVIAITGGKTVPSRRYRIDAIIPYVRRLGIEMEELCSRVACYPPSRKALRPGWFIAALAERLTYVFRARKYDAVILQRELISTMATIEHLLPAPRIFDVDDAIFLYRDGKAAKRIASGSTLVVCGNQYLADTFSQWNDNIAVIPTGVDTERLKPAESKSESEGLTIGWIGTVGNFGYLEQIKTALAYVLRSQPSVRFRLVSSELPEFLRDLGNQFEFVRWRPGIEEIQIPTFSIGVMPLEDNAWARGKCAFKMLQYMAAGVPVIASDVGVNGELLRKADIGIGVKAGADWTDALMTLLSDEQARRRLGQNGRALAVSAYSLDNIAAMWKDQFDRIL